MSGSGPRTGGCPGRVGLALDLLEGTGRHSAHRRRCPECARAWERLRDLESRLQKGVADRPSPERCPEAADWAALADGAVSGRRRADLVEHLVDCDACAALWGFLSRLPVDEDRRREPWSGDGPEMELVRESPAAADEKPAPGRRAGGWRLRVAAVLAAGGILAWLALPPPPVAPGADERVRGGDRGIVTEVVREGRDGTSWLGWTEVPTVDEYRLRLWDGAGELLVERSLPAGQLRWAGPFPEADELYWQVEGLRHGEVVAASPVDRLEGAGREARSGR